MCLHCKCCTDQQNTANLFINSLFIFVSLAQGEDCEVLLSVRPSVRLSVWTSNSKMIAPSDSIFLVTIFFYTRNGSFRVNSTNGSQVSVSNIAQKIAKITLVSIMKACQILGCNSEYFWRYSLSNFLFCFAFLPSRL